MAKDTVTVTSKRGHQVNLDKLDLRILQALHQDGRITKKDMSESVGLSATRCWERMRKLEKNGVIEGYHADLDLKRLFDVSFFFTQLKVRNYTFSRHQRVVKTLQRMNEVATFYSVMGAVDYFLIVIARDIEHYQSVIETILSTEDVDLDYTTFPITQINKKPYGTSFIDIFNSV